MVIKPLNDGSIWFRLQGPPSYLADAMPEEFPPPPVLLDLNPAIKRYTEGNFVDALAVARAILAQQPAHIPALNLAGASAQRCGLGEQAEAYWREALRCAPQFADAHNNLGNLLHQQRRLAEAETAYRSAVAVDPDHQEAHYNLGNLLREQQRVDEAELAYRCVIRINPGHVRAHNNLGSLLKAQSRFGEAESAYRCAIRIDPGNANALSNLGNVLKDQQRYAEAEAAYRQAIGIDASHASASYNLGLLLLDQQRMVDAEAAFRRAISVNPNHAEARMKIGQLCLAQGRFGEGWRYYAARFNVSPQPSNWPQFPWPPWRGEALQGKSLLVWPEQGYGDEIQFVRYLPVLKAHGASRITLVCKPALARLFASLGDVDQVIPLAETISFPQPDFWTPLLSIPEYLGTTLESIPATIPYLQAAEADRQRWRQLMPRVGLRVGLVWRGSAGHANDANRSLPGLATLRPLWQIPGVNWVSLQKGQGEEEARSPSPPQSLLNLGGAMEDFADAAAIVDQLDLVICVDTAIAHLAGALGKPCWVLLPVHGTDWRWLRDRDDSPWYPGQMRLFRQARHGDWTETVAAVVQSLAEFGRPDATVKAGSGLCGFPGQASEPGSPLSS